MSVIVEIPARAVIREAADLVVRAHQVCAGSILAQTKTNDIAEVLVEIACGATDEASIQGAAARLWTMPEAERIEALGMEDDDEKSYLAALYNPAA